MKPKQHTDETSITQVKRHRTQPKVRVSLTLVKRILKQANIKPETDRAYNIYECGHVFDNDTEQRVIKYFPGEGDQKNRSKRICPVCWENFGKKYPLITKYKKCSCGAEHVSKRAQSSICCSSCSSTRKAAKGTVPNKVYKNNGHLADPSRCSCIHRDDCLTKYLDYEAIPCKGCRRYKEAVTG